MSESEEKENIKKMAKLRATIEKRVEAMETELDELKTLLKLIDSTLIKEGFKRAEISQPTPTQTKPKKGIPLKTVTGELLAQIYTEKDSMQILLAEDKNFEINIPPFTSFFVERVLAKMQEKDKEDADKGKITPERTLSYNIKRDGNRIQEIAISNLRPERFREIKSSVRWTLEKMYEKMKQNK
jgi:hypothetical protein